MSGKERESWRARRKIKQLERAEQDHLAWQARQSPAVGTSASRLSQEQAYTEGLGHKLSATLR